MMDIKNENDLRSAYEMLRVYKVLRALNLDCAIEMKRKIRAYQNRPEGNKRIIKGDYDGMTVLVKLPDYLETEAEAIEYFENVETIEYRPSAYDCTGQAFTSWYKVFRRFGKFYAYHRICMDV
jgi:hypothetical protein